MANLDLRCADTGYLSDGLHMPHTDIGTTKFQSIVWTMTILYYTMTAAGVVSSNPPLMEDDPKKQETEKTRLSGLGIMPLDL